MGTPMLSWVSESVSDLVRDYEALKTFLGNVRKVLEDEASRRGGGWVVEKTGSSPFVVIGDIHGDFMTLRKLLSRIGSKAVMKGDTNLVFLGDYIDRGPYQLEVLLTVLRLKVEFPESVTLLRGNHEPPPNLLPYPHDFPEVLRRVYGYVKGKEVYSEFMELFNLLPAVLHVRGEALMMHGGLPTETYRKEVTLLEYLQGKSEDQRMGILTELLWNDPIESNIVRSPSPRGAGYLFGRKVTEWVLKRFRVKAVFRGHEPVNSGFKINHGGRVVTLFTRLGPPYFNDRAAYAVIDTSMEGWWRRLRNFIVFIREETR